MDGRHEGAAADAGDADVSAWPVRPAWLAGIAVSAAALLAQALLLLILPRCRKYEEKILLQLTIARLANSVSDYVATERQSSTASFECAIFFAMYSDFALACFMFVFSKHLHDRAVVVFAGAKWGAGRAAGAVWAAATPPAAIGAVLLHRQLYEPYRVYYMVYASVKFLVLVTNAGLFVRILRVVFARGMPARVAVVSFALVTLTSLHALLSDLFTVFYGEYRAVIDAFFAINAFQGVHVLVIFVLLVRGHTRCARDTRARHERDTRARRARDTRARALSAALGTAAPRADLLTDSTDDNNIAL